MILNTDAQKRFKTITLKRSSVKRNLSRLKWLLSLIDKDMLLYT